MNKNKMNILLVSSDDIHGGAAMSCFRVLNALNKNGHPSKVLVQRKKSNSEFVVSTSNTRLKAYYNFFRFGLERLFFVPLMKSKQVLFSFTLGLTGENIQKNNWIQEADIINIHWISNSFLSIRSIKKLLELDKKLVWTLHDMWAFTGGCHYVGDCINYQKTCGNCPFLKNPEPGDISNKIYRKKLRLLFEKNQEKIVFATSSNWLKEIALKSSLLKNYRIESIPTPVDTSLFAEINQLEVRTKLELKSDKIYILFAAMNISDKRKGLDYFIEALEKIKENYDQLSTKIELVVFGKANNEVLNRLPFEVNNFGFISSQEKLVDIFNAVDLFVIPSLEDNLPNIIMESMACCNPVVGFRSGGIPQMIDHKKSGYLSEFKSANDLADGMAWVIENNKDNVLGKAAREKVLLEFSEEVVAQKYIDLYESVLNDKSS